MAHDRERTLMLHRWSCALLACFFLHPIHAQNAAAGQVNELIARSKTLLSNDSMGEALRLADRAVVLARGDRPLTARAELQLAKVFGELGNYDKSLEHGL